MNQLKRDDVIALSDNGDRWEGDSLNGLPFGYGCVCNSEKKIIYKGFMFEGKKVCYGSDLYSDAGETEYEGGYYNNKRHGFGRWYDQEKELQFNGLWYNDNPIKKKSIRVEGELKEEDLHFGLEEIVISGCMDNLESFRLIGFDNLKRLVIEKNCLKRMKCFSIEECSKLISVELSGEKKETPEVLSTERVFKIIDCKNLRTIRIGDYWYTNNYSIQLQDLPRLQTFSTGKKSFYATSTLTLSDLPSLNTFATGCESFLKTKTLTLSSIL